MNITQHLLLALVAGAIAAAAGSPARAQASSPPAAKSAVVQKTFATPEEAAAALVAAVSAKDANALLAVVGPGSASWLFSGDLVADANDWKVFLAAYERRHKLEARDTRTILEVGEDAWPFPAPLVKRGSRWAFDANAGRAEIVQRRVGRNELDAMETLRAIVDAQRDYASLDADGNGLADYARKFRSSPDKKDGLFWPTQAGEPASPLGPLVAVAAQEGYGKAAGGTAANGGERQAYHGYYYKIITAQGKDAAGGAYDYVVGGKLLGGFAVVAWPASYRNSGVVTLIVNHDGVVYEKDLGPQTANLASTMTRFNPDSTWRKAQ